MSSPDDPKVDALAARYTELAAQARSLFNETDALRRAMRAELVGLEGAAGRALYHELLAKVEAAQELVAKSVETLESAS